MAGSDRARQRPAGAAARVCPRAAEAGEPDPRPFERDRPEPDPNGRPAVTTRALIRAARSSASPSRRRSRQSSTSSRRGDRRSRSPGRSSRAPPIQAAVATPSVSPASCETTRRPTPAPRKRSRTKRSSSGIPARPARSRAPVDSANPAARRQLGDHASAAGRVRTAPPRSMSSVATTWSPRLVLGQLVDQGEDQRNILARGRMRDGALNRSGGSISRLRILPVGPFGRSSRNQTRRGYL